MKRMYLEKVPYMFTEEIYFPKTISQWEFDYGLLIKITEKYYRSRLFAEL